MGALNSVGLWTIIGLLGIAVPIIIHLLYRKHRRQTDWAAMELLRKALVTRSGQVKIEDLLILALRCLALALLALALMRITLDSNSAIGEKRIGMVVAIDASYSMNHGEFSRFKSAVAKASEILEKTAEGGTTGKVYGRVKRRIAVICVATFWQAKNKIKCIVQDLLYQS